MRAVKPSTASRPKGMSQMRTSTVPCAGLGRTSHHRSLGDSISSQASEFVHKLSVGTPVAEAGRNSADRQTAHDLDPMGLEASGSTAPEGAVG